MVDVAHGRLDVFPAHIGHQCFEIPAIDRGPGGEATAQRMAGVQLGRDTGTLQDVPQQADQAAGLRRSGAPSDPGSETPPAC